MTDAEFECLLQMSKILSNTKLIYRRTTRVQYLILVGNVPTEKIFFLILIDAAK